MVQQLSSRPFERARATESRLHCHFVRALQEMGLDDEMIACLMDHYDEFAVEPSNPASSADLYRCDEQEAPEYIPLD